MVVIYVPEVVPILVRYLSAYVIAVEIHDSAQMLH